MTSRRLPRPPLAALAVIAALLALLGPSGTAHAQRCPKAPLPEMAGLWALAVTWQPAFCETRSARRRPAECADAADATAFTLHGLWPQWQEYCVAALPEAMVRENPRVATEPCAFRAARDWDELPTLPLPADVAADVARVMPGVRSHLDRHEYVKHGSCSGLDPAAYYGTAIGLVDALNASSMRAFINGRHGEEMTVASLCGAIADALGPAAAAAVEADAPLHRGPDGVWRRYLTELRIWLRPVDGRLALEPGNFVPVPRGATTLGPDPANPLCDDRLYVDRPGLGR